MSALTEAMAEYAQAIRGDWSNFDGRSERDVIESWIAEIQNPSSLTLQDWRNRLELCLGGNGHWHGIAWGNCHPSECPTAVTEEEERKAAIAARNETKENK